ncbi:GAF and ANTAR domain-containing protein [Nocardia sp. NPDC004568]|uniref:GAF and ANTAR domain-containing protein n=1 Tax=Nocardia sp. NPDC004568 TaxID=3154551 RepID=UPI0033A76A35
MAIDTRPDPGDDAAAEVSGPSRTPADLAERLGDLARYLESRADVTATLQGIVDTAVDTVPGAAYAGVSVIARRRMMETPIVSASVVSAVDRAQIEFGQGPCLTALYERHTVAMPDTASEQRWPRFAARAAELGIGSMLSFQLYVLDDDLGALNLYACASHAFGADSERVGRLFAAHAGVAMATARQVSQLKHAIDTRDLIGQAKGILMERYKLTAEQAFALLVRASQHSNTKLTEIASYLCRSGELPTGP